MTEMKMRKRKFIHLEKGNLIRESDGEEAKIARVGVWQLSSFMMSHDL